MSEARAWRCGGCGRAGVTGIYCDRCRERQSEFIRTPPPFAAGEVVWFEYRGTDKRGIVESVKKVNATVLIEVRGGKKERFVTVPFGALRKGPRQ